MTPELPEPLSDEVETADLSPEQLAPPAPPAPMPLRVRVARGFDHVAGWAAAAARFSILQAPLWLALAAAPVLFVWPLLPALLPALGDNSLDLVTRIVLLVAIALSTAALGVAARVVYRRNRAHGSEAAGLAVKRLRDRLLPLLVLPFVPAILLTSIETSRPVFTLLLCALAAAATVVAVYRVPAAPRLAAAFAPGSALSRYFPPVAVGLLVAGYAVLFSLYSVAQHHALKTAIFDLAIYDSIFWNSAHGYPLATNFIRGGNHMAAHFDPILVLLSPLYLIAPRAETILALQSAWLASGAIPVFAIARRHLDSNWAGLALAAIWILYPAVHGANLYDFHSLTLIAPLVPWALHLSERGHLKSYALVLGLLLLTREDVSLLVVFIGLHLLISGKARLGTGTIVAAVVWLAFAKFIAMPDPGLLMGDSKKSYSYAYYYRDLIPKGLGEFGIISSLLANPIYALGTVLKSEKLLFFGRLFLPLLFLPFLAPRGRIVLAYGLAFCLLATRGAVFSLHYQYSALLFPVAIALVPPALARIREGWLAGRFGLDGRRLSNALLAGAVVATALVSAEHGAILPNTSFRAGPQEFVRSPTPEQRKRHAVVRKAVELLPLEASVGATDHLAPHVSNRRNAYPFPGPRTEYLLIETNNQNARREIDRLRRAGELEVLNEEEGIGFYRRIEPAP